MVLYGRYIRGGYIGPLEVKVVGSEGQFLPEINHDGINYVVANAGESFEVSVRNSGDRRVGAKLKVEGTCVGYHIALEKDEECNFEGFFEQPLKTKAFVFKKPDFSDGNGINAATTAGVLIVTFHNLVQWDCPGKGCETCQFQGHEDGFHSEAVVKGLSDSVTPKGKKFFNAPSLSVMAGDSKIEEKGERESTHDGISGTSLFSMKLQCETADTLLLRKILDKQNPDHVAMLPPVLQDMLNNDSKGRRTAVAAKRGGTSRHADVKPDIGQPSTPADDKEKGGTHNAEDEDDDIQVRIVTKTVPTVDLDAMPDGDDDDCTFLFATGPRKRRRYIEL